MRDFFAFSNCLEVELKTDSSPLGHTYLHVKPFYARYRFKNK